MEKIYDEKIGKECYTFRSIRYSDGKQLNYIVATKRHLRNLLEWEYEDDEVLIYLTKKIFRKSDASKLGYLVFFSEEDALKYLESRRSDLRKRKDRSKFYTWSEAFTDVPEVDLNAQVIFKKKKLDMYNTIPAYIYLCPKCKTELHIDYGLPKFCPECGRELNWTRREE